jgi:hypothetical protein
MPVPISSIVEPDYLRMAELNRLIELEDLILPPETSSCELARNEVAAPSMPGVDHQRIGSRPPCQYPGKKAAWLKFCRKCGVDISGYAAYVRLCKTCNAHLARFGAGEYAR